MSTGDAPQAVVRIKTGEEWSAFVTRLRRPTAAAKQVGALLVRTSQKAFRDQALGDFHWKPRSVYARSPTSGKKYLVNIANAVNQLAGRQLIVFVRPDQLHEADMRR